MNSSEVVRTTTARKPGKEICDLVPRPHPGTTPREPETPLYQTRPPQRCRPTPPITKGTQCPVHKSAVPIGSNTPPVSGTYVNLVGLSKEKSPGDPSQPVVHGLTRLPTLPELTFLIHLRTLTRIDPLTAVVTARSAIDERPVSVPTGMDSNPTKPGPAGFFGVYVGAHVPSFLYCIVLLLLSVALELRMCQT